MRPNTSRPTIFKNVNKTFISDNPENKFCYYLALIPFAEPDDPYLKEAKREMAYYSNGMILRYYRANGRKRAIIEIVKSGCINDETLHKLLDEANEKSDAIFAAVLLDVMKNSGQPDEDRFAL